MFFLVVIPPALGLFLFLFLLFFFPRYTPGGFPDDVPALLPWMMFRFFMAVLPRNLEKFSYSSWWFYLHALG